MYLATVLLAAAAARADEGAAGLEARLRAVTVSELDLRGVSAGEALRGLAEAAGGEPAAVLVADPGASSPRITMRLRNVSLYDALRYVCEAAGLTFRVDARAVVIRPAEAPAGPIVTRAYPVQPSAVEALRQAGYPVTVQGAERLRPPARSFRGPDGRP